MARIKEIDDALQAKQDLEIEALAERAELMAEAGSTGWHGVSWASPVLVDTDQGSAGVSVRAQTNCCS